MSTSKWNPAPYYQHTSPDTNATLIPKFGVVNTLITSANRHEQTTFVRQSTNPGKLCEPRFRPPVVRSKSKKILRIFSNQSAWIRAHVFDIVHAKPTLHFRQSMTVLLRMMVLIAQPGQASRGFVSTITEHRIERNHSIPS